MKSTENIRPRRTQRAANRLQTTVAFIDGVNLHKSILRSGWKLDYKRFRCFLADRYQVGTAYLFLGYIHRNRGLYRDLKNWGYTLVFRPTCRLNNGQTKGNCDTDLAVLAVAGCCDGRYDKAVLVSGDGDFLALALFLASRSKLEAIVAPSFSSCSPLLRDCGTTLTLVESFRDNLEYAPSPTWETTSFSCRANNFPFCSSQTSPGTHRGQHNHRPGSAG